MNEEQYDLLKRRDEEIAALYGYIGSLEEELREARGESAHQFAREDADKRISELRYQHGLRSGGGLRG